MPQVALGLWKMTNGEECQQAVATALDLGYRHFDTAQVYGNEGYLGEALEEATVKRQEVFITTKIASNTLLNNQKPKRLKPSLERSLKALRTDYVDLLLLHFPRTGSRQAAWPIMEEVYEEGLAKSIGVSNYTVRHLEELLASCQVKPAVNQVELHVYLQQPDLLSYCKKQGIVVEAYSPLVHGEVGDDQVLKGIAKKHNKTIAQVMLRWCIEVGTVPLPKSVHKDRLAQNIDIFDFKLDSEDMKKLAGLDRDYRTCWDPSDVE